MVKHNGWNTMGHLWMFAPDGITRLRNTLNNPVLNKEINSLSLTDIKTISKIFSETSVLLSNKASKEYKGWGNREGITKEFYTHANTYINGKSPDDVTNGKNSLDAIFAKKAPASESKRSTDDAETRSLLRKRHF